MFRTRSVKRHTVTQPSDPSYRLIPLTQGKNAIVDTEDFERVNAYHWWIKTDDKTCYAETNVPNPRKKWGQLSVKMHRFIMDCKKGEYCDHINFDGLDNRKKNLRKCTANESAQHRRMQATNKCGLKGVNYIPKLDKWGANITVNKKRICLSVHLTPLDAARAYDAAAINYHGQFAVINFAKK